MSDAVDGRRRRYVPLDVYVAHGEFGTKLYDKWGMEGLCTWMLFLAACKRETTQGTFRYSTDDEAWGKLGARATMFTLDEFFAFTARFKKTSRRRHGRITDVSCTPWIQWNKEFDRQNEAERSSRKRGTNAPTKRKKPADVTPTEVDFECETPYPLLEKYVKSTGWQLLDDGLTDELVRLGANDLAVVRMLRMAADIRERETA